MLRILELRQPDGAPLPDELKYALFVVQHETYGRMRRESKGGNQYDFLPITGALLAKRLAMSDSRRALERLHRLDEMGFVEMHRPEKHESYQVRLRWMGLARNPHPLFEGFDPTFDRTSYRRSLETVKIPNGLIEDPNTEFVPALRLTVFAFLAYVQTRVQQDSGFFEYDFTPICIPALEERLSVAPRTLRWRLGRLASMGYLQSRSAPKSRLVLYRLPWDDSVGCTEPIFDEQAWLRTIGKGSHPPRYEEAVGMGIGKNSHPLHSQADTIGNDSHPSIPVNATVTGVGNHSHPPGPMAMAATPIGNDSGNHSHPRQLKEKQKGTPLSPIRQSDAASDATTAGPGVGSAGNGEVDPDAEAKILTSEQITLLSTSAATSAVMGVLAQLVAAGTLRRDLVADFLRENKPREDGGASIVVAESIQCENPMAVIDEAPGGAAVGQDVPQGARAELGSKDFPLRVQTALNRQRLPMRLLNGLSADQGALGALILALAAQVPNRGPWGLTGYGWPHEQVPMQSSPIRQLFKRMDGKFLDSSVLPTHVATGLRDAIQGLQAATAVPGIDQNGFEEAIIDLVEATVLGLNYLTSTRQMGPLRIAIRAGDRLINGFLMDADRKGRFTQFGQFVPEAMGIQLVAAYQAATKALATVAA